MDDAYKLTNMKKNEFEELSTMVLMGGSYNRKYGEIDELFIHSVCD